MRRLHRLAIDNRGAGRRFTTSGDTHLAAQFGVHALQRPVLTPCIEIVIDSAFGRKFMGQHVPLATGLKHIKDGVHDFTHIGTAFPSSGLGRWDQRFKLGPFVVGQVTGVGFSCHADSLLTTLPLFKWPLRLCLATDSNALYVIREVDESENRSLVGWRYITLSEMVIGVKWNLQAGGRGMGGGATQTVMISGSLFGSFSTANFTEDWLTQNKSLRKSVQIVAKELAGNLNRYLYG